MPLTANQLTDIKVTSQKAPIKSF